MAVLIYANANSLFDFTNGAARSIKLILEEIAASGVKVFAITSCVSDGPIGFKYCREIWSRENRKSPGKHPLIQRFVENGVQYSLMYCDQYSRQLLTSCVQELIYRETELWLEAASRSNDTSGFLSWGNLLLEETLYRRARGFGIRTFFYLASPSYLGKPWPIKYVVDQFWTDSNATRDLYQKDLKENIAVLPKIFSPSGRDCASRPRQGYRNICLINPSIHKGLEHFIKVADMCLQKGCEYHFIMVDAACKLDRGLHELGLNRNQLPSNVEIRQGTPDLDQLFSDVSILLLLSIWHESGSRLIGEGHRRGVPVLAFATGGTPELMSYAKQDLFALPKTASEWNPSSLIDRISQLLADPILYDQHSKYLIANAEKLDAINRHRLIDLIHESLEI